MAKNITRCKRCGNETIPLDEEEKNKFYCSHCGVLRTGDVDAHRVEEKTNGLTPGSITVHWGENGGFYFHNGLSTRICFGPIAITYMPEDLDTAMKKMSKRIELPSNPAELDKVIDQIEKAKEKINEENIPKNGVVTLKFDIETEKKGER